MASSAAIGPCPYGEMLPPGVSRGRRSTQRGRRAEGRRDRDAGPAPSEGGPEPGGDVMWWRRRRSSELLDDELARRFGVDLSGVEVRTDSEVAVREGAAAVTQASRIDLAPGVDRLPGAETRGLLAHELAH